MRTRDRVISDRIVDHVEAVRVEQLRLACRELATELARAKRALRLTENQLQRIRAHRLTQNGESEAGTADIRADLPPTEEYEIPFTVQ